MGKCLITLSLILFLILGKPYIALGDNRNLVDDPGVISYLHKSLDLSFGKEGYSVSHVSAPFPNWELTSSGQNWYQLKHPLILDKLSIAGIVQWPSFQPQLNLSYAPLNNLFVNLGTQGWGLRLGYTPGFIEIYYAWAQGLSYQIGWRYNLNSNLMVGLGVILASHSQPNLSVSFIFTT